MSNDKRNLVRRQTFDVRHNMKKDITIPEVENVFLAAVSEWNDDFMQKVWNVYLINDSDFKLESVMVVSKAFGTIDGEMKKTSLLRHAFVEVPSVSVVKVEMIEESVLALNNEFMLTYFIGQTLYDKKFTFKANFANDSEIEEVPILFVDGIIVKQTATLQEIYNKDKTPAICTAGVSILCDIVFLLATKWSCSNSEATSGLS